MDDVRTLALEVLVRCQRQRIPSDTLLAPRLARARLEPRDRRFVTQIVRTTHRWRGRADHVLDARLKRGVRSLDPETLNILRMGYVQLFHLDQIPPHAAVHTSVDLAWRKGGRGKASLVNSVLRGLLSRPPAREEWGRGRLFEGLEGELSHPAWLLERWVAQWGEPRTRRICEWNNQSPDLHLRVTGGAEVREAIRLRLEVEGHTIRPGDLLDEILRVSGGFAVRDHPLLKDGAVSPQDESQALVGRLWPDGGGPVLDVCAAPGTKSTHLAEQDPQLSVISADVTLGRVQRIAQSRGRLGLDRIQLVVADGKRPPFRPGFARVLLDAPCSGLGVLRRRPDARWLRTPGDLADAARLQARLLRAAADLVRPGGWLVYSVCSLEPEETRRQIAAFLEEQPRFESQPLPEWIPEELRDPEGALCVVPGTRGMEGVYAALLRRQPARGEA